MRAPDYFSRPERVAALHAECMSWIGTPFYECSLVKGPRGGVDCAGFVGAVLAAIGAIPHAISVPPYPINHADHSQASMLRAWFEKPDVRRRVRAVDEDEAHLDGDLVFPFAVARPRYRRPVTERRPGAEHHLAIRIGDAIFMVARRIGCWEFRVTQLEFHRARYRLLEDIG